MRALVVFLVACLVFLESGATPKRVQDGDLSVASLSRLAEARKLLQTRENPNGQDDELTSRERRIFNNLALEQLLERAGVENGTITTTQLEEVLRLVSGGLFVEKPVEAAAEGEEARFLLLTPELLIDEFGSEEGLTRDQFSEAAPVVLSCLSHERCALITDVEFLENDDDHDHDHEEHEDHGHDHEQHENNDEHEGHDHDEHEGHDHDEHEGHDHEEHEDNDEHEGHDHEEHEDNDEHEGHDHEEHEDNDEHEGHDHNEHEGHEGHGHHEDEDDDDDTETIKIVAAFVLFAEAILGAMVPIVLGRFNGFEAVLSLINCFAGGVILSTGLIHLVPHVIEYEGEVDSIGDYPLGMTVVSLSFALVFFVEHILFDVHSHEHATDTTQLSTGDKEKEDKEKEVANMSFFEQLESWKDPLVLLLATAVHSILEALVLGIENDSYTVWLLFASIAGHKGATALALSSRFWTKQPPIGYALAYSILFAITAPLGVWIGTSLEDVPAKTNLILTGMSTGTFLYIGAYEVISDEFHKQDSNPFTRLSPVVTRYLKFLAVLAGILMIAGVAFIPHPDHDHGHCGH